MKSTKLCKNCNEFFESRRSNHVYCTTSCKTKASYKRNGYKYISGHYQKAKIVVESNNVVVPIKNNFIKSISKLENKIDALENKPAINSSSLSNAALGSVAGDAAVFGLKKILAPNSLPATKGDVIALRNELKELKKIIQTKNLNTF